MSLGIVILTKSNLDYLFKCLSSIKRHTHKTDYTIYVADTGSTIDELEKIASFIKQEFSLKKNCKLLKLNYYNFAKCNNYVINNHVQEKYVLLCNNDIELINECIDIMIERYESQENVGTVGCRLLYPHDDSIQHAGQFVYPRGPSLECGHRGINTFNKYQSWEPVVGNTAGFMLISRDLYVKIKGFNERYRVCFEDVELNLNVMSLGLDNMYCDDAICHHYESLTRGKSLPREALEDHQHILTAYFNSLKMDIKDKIVKLSVSQNT